MLKNALDAAIRLVHNALVDTSDKRTRKRNKPLVTTEDGEDPGVLIGKTIPSSRNPNLPEEVRLRFKVRLRQSFLTGLPGAGKSTTLRTLILDDLNRGNGIINLDWMGESTDLLLQFLGERFAPEELLERLVLIDLRKVSAFGEPDEPVVGFNPICPVRGDAYATIAQFKNALRQMWGDSTLGVQLINDLEHAVLALALSPAGPFTLLDIERILIDPAFRQKVLAGVTDPVIRRFYEQWEQVKDPAGRVLPVTNKLSPFILSNLRLRDTVTRTEKIYSFDDHFARVKNPIVLICVAADDTGDTVAGAAAGLLLNAAITAAMRSDRLIAEEPTQGMHFVLDEAPQYAAAIEEPLSKLLRIGRKFGAFSTVIAQSPSNLPNSIRNLLIDVAATKIFFGQGPQQADHLASWVSSDEMPKPIVRALLMQAKPGEALLLRPGHPPCRMKAYMSPFPKVEDEKVRELRRATLAHWGTRPTRESDASPSGPMTGEPSHAPDATAQPTAAIETREIPEMPAPSRRRKKA